MGHEDSSLGSVGLEKFQSLRAVVLLAGTVRPGPMQKASGRSPLDLPVTPGMSVLGWWAQQFDAMATAAGLSGLTVRVMLDRSAPMPDVSGAYAAIHLRVEQDPFEFRGTGGLLSDLAMEYKDDDQVLVVNGGQLLLDPLYPMLETMVTAEADVSLLSSPESNPSGLTLLRCGSLREIAKVGFVDLKEQALPAIAENHRVQIVRRNDCEGLPIRTLSGYLDGLRAYHRRLVADGAATPADLEDGRATFSLQETGATVDGGAVIHDSVVLGGGVVEAGAVVVRSMVGPGGVVRAGASVVDSLIGKEPDPSSKKRKQDTEQSWQYQDS